MRKPPTTKEAANHIPNFDRARVERFERYVAEVRASGPRYQVERALGDLVTVVGQRLVSATTNRR